jgi:hypothetical protein
MIVDSANNAKVVVSTALLVLMTAQDVSPISINSIIHVYAVMVLIQKII